MTWAFQHPDVYEVEVSSGRGTPLPDWVAVIQEAQYWGVSPMEIEEWPLARIRQGQMYRQATHAAQEAAQKPNP